MNKSNLSLFIWIGLVTTSLALCDRAGQYCVYGSTNEAGQNVLTIHSAAKGWASIGIGNSMISCTEIYLIWKNSKGQIVLSPRNSSSHSMPIYNHASRSYLTNDRYQVPAWANLAASIVVPYRLSRQTRFIYASSGSPVQSPDLKNSNFLMHDSKGHLTGLDFPLQRVNVVHAQSKISDESLGEGSGGTSNAVEQGQSNAVEQGQSNGVGQKPRRFWDRMLDFFRVPLPQSQPSNPEMRPLSGESQNKVPQNSGMASPMGANGLEQNPSSPWGQQGSNWNQYSTSPWGQQGYNWNQYPTSWGQQGYNWNQYPTSWGQQGQGSSAWNYGWGQYYW